MGIAIRAIKFAKLSFLKNDEFQVENFGSKFGLLADAA
jgi:hypothetical protein